MKYEYGLANYFLHELGNNLSEDNALINNENKMFDSKMTDEERIIREIDRIKNKSKKYDNYLDKDKDNIKDIIVCIDLLLGIEVSFKSNFISIASNILEDDRLSIIFDLENNYDQTIKETDKLFKNIINEYLDKIVHN